jgi:hypothetical protein
MPSPLLQPSRQVRLTRQSALRLLEHVDPSSARHPATVQVWITFELNGIVLHFD